MRFLSATQIHNGEHWLAEGAILEIDDAGTIVAIHDAGAIPADQAERYEGILCPGFVNVHCHLELSHMKGFIEEGNQLVPFLQGVMLGRNNFSPEQKEKAITEQLWAMKQEGIVAVGDIANGTDTLKFREHAGLHMHTFVESLGFTETGLEARFAYPTGVYEQFAAQQSDNYVLRQSIVPHAPYSVSGKLFDLINDFDRSALLSIHNQETLAEQQYYENKTGPMLDLYNTLRIDPSFFEASGKSSLQTYLPQLDHTHPLLLVHNTFMQTEDVEYLKNSGFDYWLCLCPNANWYIERRMPPVSMFVENDLPLCLGTDSLASNHQLSIWSEILTLQQHFPELSLETLLRWGTANGAAALQLSDKIGSFQSGKMPGVLHISTKNKIERLV